MLLILGILLFTGCLGGGEGGKNMKIDVNSPSFEEKGEIPVKYTCSGQGINPEINIGNLPEETKSIALIVDDPDAPGGKFTHWIAWNISPDTQRINENSVPSEAVEGLNGFGKTGYGAPCPPKGHGTHRYRFKVYALDKEIELSSKSKQSDLEKAMKNHVLAEGKLTGKYSR